MQLKQVQLQLFVECYRAIVIYYIKKTTIMFLKVQSVMLLWRFYMRIKHIYNIIFYQCLTCYFFLVNFTHIVCVKKSLTGNVSELFSYIGFVLWHPLLMSTGLFMVKSSRIDWVYKVCVCLTLSFGLKYLYWFISWLREKHQVLKSNATNCTTWTWASGVTSLVVKALISGVCLHQNPRKIHHSNLSSWSNCPCSKPCK